MCGIYGLVGGSLSDIARAASMRDRLSHRGPDDAGIWSSPDESVILAHRRLAVIDLSPSGHQPMISPDGRVAITFNGEIYNFRELREELLGKGVLFTTSGDTEVILAAYRYWGEEFLSRLNGMFAFAIFDGGSGNAPPSLLLARDRAGEKPLYYSLKDRRFEFASELKSISSGHGLSPDAINHYLALGYIPSPLSLLEGVYKLPPGHYARLNLGDFKFCIAPYWQLPQLAHEDTSLEEIADEATRLFVDSVRMRMISDVSLGILLSGGLDSSLVAAAAAQCSPEPVTTFTVKLPGSSLDESEHARKVAAYFGTRHHELEMDGSSLAILDKLSGFVDEPLADSSLLPTFMVSQLTRSHVTVALGGDGGDELFGGYNDYRTAMQDQALLRWVPAPAFRMAAEAASRLPAGVRGRNKVWSLRGGPFQQIVWGTPYFDIRLREQLLSQDYLASLNGLESPELDLLQHFNGGASPIDRMTRTHFQGILPGDYLTKVDRASMAHSLEIRCPFLDHRLIEFCFSRIPDEYKASASTTRIAEKVMARRMLPADINLQRKQGFSIPLDEWFRDESQESLLHRMAGLPSFIQSEAVRDLIGGLHKGRANGARIFALIMLATACRNLDV
jgi:asparagine synthase (glutamine-hydrolysing)